MDSSDIIFGFVLPIFYSIVAGSLVGLIAYLIINKLIEIECRIVLGLDKE